MSAVEQKNYTTMSEVEKKNYTTMAAVLEKKYQNSDQVVTITKNTVTAAFIKTLGLLVGDQIQMGPNAKITWANVTNQPTIPTKNSQLQNDSGYTTMSAVEKKGYTTMSAVEDKGYQNADQVGEIANSAVKSTKDELDALKNNIGYTQIGSDYVVSPKIVGAYGGFTQGFKVDVPFVIPSLGNLSAIMKLGITDTGSSWGVVIPEAEEDPAYGNYEANISISEGTINVYAGNQLNLDGQGDVSIKTIGKISIGDSDDIVNIGGIEDIGQTLRSLILVRTQERQNLSQNAGVDDFWNFASLGKVAGYTRIISNVSISGTMSSFMNHYQTNYNSDNTSIRVKNLSTQAFKGNIRVTCLYVREGFYERWVD